MSREKVDIQTKFLFSDVWPRIIESTGIKRYKELAELINVAASRVSERAKENNFPVEWGYWVAKKFGLNLDWLLTGEGEKTCEKEMKSEALLRIQEWLNDIERTNKDYKVWFKVEFERKFPEYAEWKKRKEGPAGQNNLSALSKIANDNSK